jgi:hypothetical protein
LLYIRANKTQEDRTMRIKETKIYKFEELSDEAKERAIAKWYEDEDYPFLQDDLTESLKSLLSDNGCEYANIKTFYSLSYSQGDGLCFTGSITKDGKTLKLTHNGRYYYATSVTMDYYDEEMGDEIDAVEELKTIYFNLCYKLEKEGYAILEYRMDNDEFADNCDANNYEFDEYGNIA